MKRCEAAACECHVDRADTCASLRDLNCVAMTPDDLLKHYSLANRQLSLQFTAQYSRFEGSAAQRVTLATGNQDEWDSAHLRQGLFTPSVFLAAELRSPLPLSRRVHLILMISGFLVFWKHVNFGSSKE